MTLSVSTEEQELAVEASRGAIRAGSFHYFSSYYVYIKLIDMCTL